jgi:hypothetical protein
VLYSTGRQSPGLAYRGEARPQYGCASEQWRGKDTPSGHWELAGVPVRFVRGYFPKAEPCFLPQLKGEAATFSRMFIGLFHANETKKIPAGTRSSRCAPSRSAWQRGFRGPTRLPGALPLLSRRPLTEPIRRLQRLFNLLSRPTDAARRPLKKGAKTAGCPFEFVVSVFSAIRF